MAHVLTRTWITWLQVRRPQTGPKVALLIVSSEITVIRTRSPIPALAELLFYCDKAHGDC